MATKLSKSVVQVEIEVETWDGIEGAVSLINTQLRCPAVTKITFSGGKSNYRLHMEPSERMKFVDMDEVKKKLML